MTSSTRAPTTPTPATGAAPAWIATRLADFDRTSLLEKLGQLAVGTAVAGFVRQFTDQTMAWQVELDLLGTMARELRAREPGSGEWMLLLEYTIPRRQHRIDAVLLGDHVVCVLEFKIGAATFARADAWQVEDYALDLRDFHGASHDLVIEPFLIATEAVTPQAKEAPVPGEAHRVGRTGLVDAILRLVHAARRREAAALIDPATWVTAPYSPAPTIVEAARTLFHQDVMISPAALAGGASVAGHRLFPEGPHANVHVKVEPALHLSVSVRSPRAQYLAEWVNAVLALDAPTARAALAKVTGYRLGLTRDLATARRWLRDAARNDRRPGLLSSSGSLRHRAYGLEMSPAFHRAYPIADWFLRSPEDVRSSWHSRWR